MLAVHGYFVYAGARKEPKQEVTECIFNKQIAQLAQLNEDQPYSYDRDALATMLDEALTKTRPKA